MKNIQEIVRVGGISGIQTINPAPDFRAQYWANMWGIDIPSTRGDPGTLG